MKKLLVLLFSILVSFNSYGETGCSEKEENDDLFGIAVDSNIFYGKDFIDSTVFLRKRNGLFFLPNESKPYSGENLCIFKNESGQKHLKGSIKNGKKHGVQTIWLKNGHKLEQVTFKDGTLNGEFMGWHLNGQKAVHGYVKNYEAGMDIWSVQNGKFTQWYENGNIRIESNFKDGEYNGSHTYWNENGQIIAESNWKDGKCVSGDC